MKKYIENDFATFRLENGIIHIIYKENTTIFLRTAMEVVAERLTFQQGNAYPILCNIKDVREIAGDACKYLAVEGSVLIKALALVHKNPLSKIHTKLYINNSPSIRMEMFMDETRALEYLTPFAQSTSVCP